jgi:hypothetical protein
MSAVEPLRGLPDVERLVVAYLLTCGLVVEQADGSLVDARPLIGGRIYSTRPSRATYPAVTIHRWGGAPQLRHPRDRDEAMLQIDSWGGTKNQAWLILDAIVAALVSGLPGVHEQGVVSRVDPFTFWDMPDADFEPPKPRWITQIVVATRARSVT